MKAPRFATAPAHKVFDGTTKHRSFVTYLNGSRDGEQAVLLSCWPPADAKGGDYFTLLYFNGPERGTLGKA